MTSTLSSARSPDRVRHPAAVLATVAVLGFLGLSAVPSGAAMLIGGTRVFPKEWLDVFPLIDSLVAPGLVLLLGFGLGSLLAAYGVWRRPAWPSLGRLERATRHHWSWAATVAIGRGQLVWIGLELVYLGADSFLQPLYGAVGLALVLLPLTGSVRRWLRR